MKETKWVEDIVVNRLNEKIVLLESNLEILPGFKLHYANEVRTYNQDKPQDRHTQSYQTDLLIREKDNQGLWTPRVVIEAKLSTVTTHDAITYSQKAATHKQIHPYLRYGIILGNRKHYPLPGRLFRHGAHFDFMLSWVQLEPRESELDELIELIMTEVNASRSLEDIIYQSRKKDRTHYTLYHKPLVLRKIK